jgi:hypothetical protein
MVNLGQEADLSGNHKNQTRKKGTEAPLERQINPKLLPKQAHQLHIPLQSNFD